MCCTGHSNSFQDGNWQVGPTTRTGESIPVCHWHVGPQSDKGEDGPAIIWACENSPRDGFFIFVIRHVRIATTKHGQGNAVFLMLVMLAGPKRLAFWARAGAHAKDSCILHLCRCAGALLGEPFALALSRLGRGPKGVMGVMSAALARPGIFGDLWAAFGHVSEKKRPSAEVTLGCDVERGS